MKGQVKKPIGQKVLDLLVDESVLTAKDYGKARIYLANQAIFEKKKGSKEKGIGELDDRIKELKDIES